MSCDDFHKLPPRQRALIALAVLLDGREGAVYLANDALDGKELEQITLWFASQRSALRMPMVGTLLRSALKELGGVIEDFE